MKISLVSCGLQKFSQSSRVREIFHQLILKREKSIELYNLDLEKEKVPFWSNEKKIKQIFGVISGRIFQKTCLTLMDLYL